VSPGSETTHGAIRLYNSDGSDSEISGNGTRCAAAFLVDTGLGDDSIAIRTGAGVKTLRLTRRGGLTFEFEMNMGLPEVADGDLRRELALRDGVREATILNVGNPQCAIFVDTFDFDWKRLGGELERHPCFPKRTNVSFVRVTGPHSIEVRFWERGAGYTMSSGTGSTGAAAAAILRGLVSSPVDIHTEAGVLPLRWEGDIYLSGPAEIVAGGEFYYSA
jgi:diaminopimelate epimerase